MFRPKCDETHGQNRCIKNKMSDKDPYSIRTSEDQTAAQQAGLIKALGSHPFLENLTEDQLKILAANAMQVEFKEGEVIFNEGDSANRFYLIQDGEVILESNFEKTGKPVTIDVIRSGDVLGWSWMFPPYYWHFDARALKPTRAVFFYATRLREECEKNSDLGFALSVRVAEVAIKRLQATRKKLTDKEKTNDS